MPVRTQAQPKASPSAFHPNSGITPAESLAYSRELLESLQKMAVKQNHKLLAQLLRLAIQEVRSLEADEG